MKRSSQILVNAGLVAFGLVAAILFSEAAIRLFLPRSRWQFWDASKDWTPHPATGWRNRSELSVTTESSFGWTVKFETNADGLLPKDAVAGRAHPRPRRILIFGDSAALGRAVRDEDRLHHVLREIMAIREHIEVINAAVEGYSTDQSLLRMEELVPRYRPDLVVYAFCANDLGGNEVSESYGVSKPKFILSPEGRLTHVPGRVVETASFVFGTSGPSRWVRNLALYQVFRPITAAWWQKKHGWSEAALSGHFGDLFYGDNFIRRANWPLLSALLTRMSEVARANGARFLFYSHPSHEEVWDPSIEKIVVQRGIARERYDRYALERVLSGIADRQRLKFCPLTDFFLNNRDRGPFHLLPRDPHANSAGYRVTAEGLAECITHWPSEET